MTYSWQYNGIAPWTDIVRWCNQHIPDYCWSNGFETITFTDEKAYAWFLLRWS
jgi:hypothetical protein